jgi:DedD protein
VKERLTGAIILVALIVLLVPELLTGPVRSAPRTAAPPPSAEGAPLRSYTINLTDEARSRGSALPASGPAPPAPVDSSASAPGATAEAPAAAAPDAAVNQSPPAAARTPPAGKPSPSPESPAAAGPRATSPARAGTNSLSTPATGSGSWVVQLGSFASRANAERLARQVRTRGFPASVSQGSSGRHLYRVRVGPVRDREAASELAGRLQAAGHSGSVVPK